MNAPATADLSPQPPPPQIGPAVFRPSEARRVLSTLTVAGILLFSGCTLIPPRWEWTQTSMNEYHALWADYTAKCVTKTGPPTCGSAFSELQAWKADLLLAAEARERGGKAPTLKSRVADHRKKVIEALK